MSEPIASSEVRASSSFKFTLLICQLSKQHAALSALCVLPNVNVPLLCLKLLSDIMAPSSPSFVLLALVFMAAQVILSAGNQQNTHTHTACILCCCRITRFILLPGYNKCVARNFGYDSVVCECNSTYCDSIASVTLPPLGHFSSYLTSMAGSRLEATQGEVHPNSTGRGG